MLISLKLLDAPPRNKTLSLSHLPARFLSPPLGSVNLFRKKIARSKLQIHRLCSILFFVLIQPLEK